MSDAADRSPAVDRIAAYLADPANCRCAECRAAHATSMRGYWERRRARTMTSRAALVARIAELEATLRHVDRCLGAGCSSCHADIERLVGRGG